MLRRHGRARSDWAFDAPTDEFEPVPGRVRHPPRWHAGADLGLLVLRLVLACALLGHGMRALSGTGGGGLTGFTGGMSLARLTGVVDLVGGALVLLGLCTPVAAAVLLGMLVDLVWARLGTGFFPRPDGGGFEPEFLLAGLSATLVLTGAGRLALDRRLPRFTRPHRTALPCLLLGVAVAVLFRYLTVG